MTGFVLPLGVIDVRAKRRAHLVTLVERTIRFDRIIIPSAAAEHFVVRDLTISGETQFASRGDPLPAALFSELAVGVRLAMDVCGGKSGTVIDILVENTTSQVQPLAVNLFGQSMSSVSFVPVTPPTDGALYHAWVETRQEIYESLHREDGDDCYFNGQEILPDTFLPKTNLWWVDEDGWKKRPVYDFENVKLGTEHGGLQVVDVETYEGFAGT